MSKIKFNKNIVILLVFALVQSIANNLAHAVTVSKMTSVNAPNWMNGSYFAFMSLGAFIILPFAGKYSDKIGRKKIFLIGTFFYAIAQLMFYLDFDAYRIHFWRFLGGFGGVQMSMIILMISDYTKEQSLKQIMIFYTLMVNIGDGIGKFIGGQLGSAHFANTFILQVILQVVLFFVMILVYRDIPKFNQSKKEVTKLTTTSKKGINFNFTNTLFIFTIIVLINYYCRTTFNNSIVIYGQKNLHFSPALIADYMLVISVVIIITLLLISPIIIRYFDLHSAIFVNLIIGSVIWLLVYFIQNNLFDISMILIYLATSVLFESTINAFVLSKTQPDYKGQMLGIVSSARFLGNMLGGFLSGFLYEYGPKVPFIMPSILLFVAAVLFIIKYKFKENKFMINDNLK